MSTEIRDEAEHHERIEKAIEDLELQSQPTSVFPNVNVSDEPDPAGGGSTNFFPIQFPLDVIGTIGSATVTLDLERGGMHWHTMTLNGDIGLAFAFPPAAGGFVFYVEITQDGTGGHSITSFPTGLLNSAQLDVLLNKGIDERTLFKFTTSDEGVTYFGELIDLVAGGAGGEFFGPWTADHDAGKKNLLALNAITFRDSSQLGIKAIDTATADGTFDRLEYDADVLGAHDFFVNRSVTTIPRFGITQTSLESNVELNMNDQDVIGVDRLEFSQDAGALITVGSPTIYVGSTGAGDLILNNVDTEAILFTHSNIIGLQETVTTLEKTTPKATATLTRIRQYLTGANPSTGFSIGDHIFAANRTTSGKTDYALLTGLAEDVTDAGFEGGFAIQIGKFSGTDIFMRFNDTKNNLIDMFKDVDMNGNDILTTDRIQFLFNTGSAANDAMVIYSSSGNNMQFNVDSTNAYGWFHGNILGLETNAQTLEKSGVQLQRIRGYQRAVPTIGNAVLSVIFAADRTTGGKTDYAEIAGIAEDTGNTTFEGGLAFLIDQAGAFNIFMRMNDAKNNLIDIFRDIDMNSQDITNAAILSGGAITATTTLSSTASTFLGDDDNDVTTIVGRMIFTDRDNTFSNPSAGTTALFMDSATGELSIKNSGGSTISLEAAGGTTDLDSLTDVTLTTPATNMVLVKSAGDWIDAFIVNANLASGVFGNITGIGAQSQALDMNSQDIDDVFQITSDAATPASSGFIRLGNDQVGIGWDLIGTGNATLEVNSADDFDFRLNAVQKFTIGANFVDLHNININWDTAGYGHSISVSTGTLSLDTDEVGDIITLLTGGGSRMSFTNTGMTAFGDLNMNSNDITSMGGGTINLLDTVTAVSGDFVMIRDATDGNLKKVNANDFLGGAGPPFDDNQVIIQDEADNTKTLTFNLSLQTTGAANLLSWASGASRTHTFSATTGTIAQLNLAQTFAAQQTINANFALSVGSTLYFDGQGGEEFIKSVSADLEFHVGTADFFRFFEGATETFNIEATDGTLNWPETGHSISSFNTNLNINLGGLGDELIIESQGDLICEFEEVTAGKYRFSGKNNNFFIHSQSATLGIGISCEQVPSTAGAGTEGTLKLPEISDASPSNAALDAAFNPSALRAAMGIIDSGGTPSIVVFSSNGTWYQFNHDSTI